jgi:hypothetical protein
MGSCPKPNITDMGSCPKVNTTDMGSCPKPNITDMGSDNNNFKVIFLTKGHKQCSFCHFQG